MRASVPEETHGGEDHECHVDDSARAHGGDERDLLRRGRDGALGLRVERREEFALRNREPVVGVDDLVASSRADAPGSTRRSRGPHRATRPRPTTRFAAR